MKKRFLFLIILCLSLTSLVACKKSDEDTSVEEQVETSDVSTDVAADDSSDEDEELLVNQYISNIGDLEDSYSGYVGVGTMMLDGTQTYGSIKDIIPTNYKLIYAKIDDTNTGFINDDNMVPKQGYFDIAYAPEGVSDASDPRVIIFTFETPYDAEKNSQHRNLNNSPLVDYKLSQVKFCPHKSNGKETGVGLTLPGFKAPVNTKDDLMSALGSDTCISQASNSVTFNKPNTTYKEIVGEFISIDVDGETKDYLQVVTLSYNVNFNEDLTNVNGDNIELGSLQSIYDSMEYGQYYAVIRDTDGNPMYLFVAEPENVNTDDMTAYVANMYGVINNEPMSFATVSSSADDNYPIKISSDGYIYCASKDMALKIGIDTDNGALSVEKQCYRDYDENGNPLYYVVDATGATTQVTTSASLDSLINDYRNAIIINFDLK